jgi:hypothetical protein
MNKVYLLAVLVGFTFLFSSFSTNPPDGNTGAPGDSLCSSCHTLNGSSLQGTISVEGFPSAITPEQTYTLTVVNRNTNDGAVRGGFQMTILGPNNTRAGEMSSPSANSKVSTSGGRQYFEHNPATAYPDSNVLKWTVQWKAPIIADGSQITWYASGNIANGNFQSTGDRIVTAKASGTIIIAGSEEIAQTKAIVFPNPGSDWFHIQLQDKPGLNGPIVFYNISGYKAAEALISDGVVMVPSLSPGVYLLDFINENIRYNALWSKI